MGFEKLSSFIMQLLGSSAIKNLSPRDKEESVLAFINQNEDKLKLTFSSPEYFPNLNWIQVKSELVKQLGSAVTGLIQPEMHHIIYDSLNFDWKAKYKDFMISNEDFKQQIEALSNKLVSRYTSRRIYGAILNFINQNVIQPFIMQAYQNRRYISNGLTRFDEINYDNPEEAINFIYAGLLILPIFDISLPIKVIMPQYQGPGTKSITFRDTENNSILRQSFIIKIKEIIKKEFPNISPYFLNIICKTFYIQEETEDVPYASKMLKIIYNFATQWKKTKKERGAESFEASWLNVSRINYKFYSYDMGTLDEFYKITIEEDL